VDICEINRCLGYATGYTDIELARANYNELKPSKRADVCGDCGECLVKCANGLDLTKNIRKARELFA
jgi:predicted aldo/keto reductase-like oxidoreductase